MPRILLAAATLALLTATAYAATPTPRPPAPPGYHYGLGNVLHADCVQPATTTTTGGGKASVSFPGCTEDGSNVGTTTTTKSSAPTPKLPAQKP